MKRVLIFTAAALAAAAAAWAGALPNAGAEDVLRFGPFVSGALQNYSYVKYGLPYSEFYEVRAHGAGGGAWAQYDHTWFAYAMRLGVTAFGGSGGGRSQLEREVLPL